MFHLRNLVGTVGGGTATLMRYALLRQFQRQQRIERARDARWRRSRGGAAGADRRCSRARSRPRRRSTDRGRRWPKWSRRRRARAGYNLAMAEHCRLCADGVRAGCDGAQSRIDVTPEDLTQTVTTQLAAAPFTTPAATGTFTLVGGTLRSPNLRLRAMACRSSAACRWRCRLSGSTVATP